MHEVSRRDARRRCRELISLGPGIKSMVSNLDSDLVLVYLLTATEGKLIDLMMMLQIHEKKASLHSITMQA